MTPKESHFLTAVEGWCWDYGYWFSGPLQLRRGEPPIVDHGALRVSGRVISPGHLKDTPTTLSFLPLRGLLQATAPDQDAFGTIQISEAAEGLQGYLAFPEEALAGVRQGLAAGCYPFVVMQGSPWTRRSSAIRSVSFTDREYRETFPDADPDIRGLL